MEPQDLPVLLVIFNRPGELQLVLRSLRRVRPKRMFVSADGPRNEVASDQAACTSTRQVIDQEIDWDCELIKRYSDENLGCERAVPAAIDWFFEQVDEGVILEDDCVADPSFFRYCGELLDRFRGNDSVGTITGNNFQRGRLRGNSSYYFTKYNHCWGWATWANVWENYSADLGDETADEVVLTAFDNAPGELQFWKNVLHELRQGRLKSWAYRFLFGLWEYRLLTVTPQRNLVRNLGFSAEATNTRRKNLQVPAAEAIDFPLTHPSAITHCVKADHFTIEKHFGVWRNPVLRTLSRLRARMFKFSGRNRCT